MNKSRFGLLALTILMSFQALPQLPAGASASDKVVIVKHHETGEEIEVRIPKPTRLQLDEFRPSRLTHAKMKEMMKTGARGAGGVAMHTLQEFPVSAATFYGGAFAVAATQLLLSPQSDPIALQNFMMHQIYDPVSHFSFMVFLASHQGNHLLMGALASKFGLIRSPKTFENLVGQIQKRYPDVEGVRLENLKSATPSQLRTYARIRAEVETLLPVPKSAKTFEASRMATGMAVAFVASGIAADFMHDPMIQHCFITPRLRLDQITKETAKLGMTPSKACDIAYDAWVSTDKVLDYFPDVVAALITSQVISKLIPLAGRGLTRMAVVLKCIRFVEVVGSIIPTGRAFVMVKNAYYFLEIHHFLTPFFKDPFESWRRSKGLDEESRKFTGWLSGPKFTPACQQELEKKFEPALLGQTPLSTLIAYLGSRETTCGPLPQTPKQALRSLSLRHEAWNSYWFTKARESLMAWQQDLMSLESNYGDSKKFQVEVLELLAKKPNADLPDIKEIMQKYDMDEGDPALAEIKSSSIGLVKFRNRGEFFLTSMICGSDYASKTVSKVWGFATKYLPPSVSVAEARGVCSMTAFNQPGHVSTFWDDGTRGYGGKSYRNLFYLLKSAVRPELLINENFEKQWQELAAKPVEIAIRKRLIGYGKSAAITQEAMNRSDIKVTEFSRIPFGMISHLNYQLDELQGFLVTLGVQQMTPTYTRLKSELFTALKDRPSLDALTKTIESLGDGELLKLSLQQSPNPEAQRFLALQYAAKLMNKELMTSVKAHFDKISGQNQEIAIEILNMAGSLIHTLPDTQIYRLVLLN